MKHGKTIIIPALSAIAGGLIVAGFLRIQPDAARKLIGESLDQTRQLDEIVRDQNDIFSKFDSLFGDDFFTARHPFEQMKRMRDRLERDFENDGGNPFDSWFEKRFGGNLDEIDTREDGDFVYYDISVKDAEKTSVNTKAENGYLTITGETKGEDNFHSSFTRVFPLPPNVDANRMEMIQESGKIVVKFPKIKT